MFFYDEQNKIILNKRTLDKYLLDSDADSLMMELLNSDEKHWSAEARNFECMLIEAGIDLCRVELWSNRSRSLKTPIIHIIQNCNSSCIMCDCWKIKDLTCMDADVFRKLLVQLKAVGATSVMLSGGEPTMHPKLQEILLACRDEDIDVELNTNGIILDRLSWLPEFNIAALVVSMDGFNAETYRFMRGTDRFDKILANTRNFKSLSQNTVIGYRVTLTNKTLLNLHKLVNIAERGSADVLSFNPLDVSSQSFSRAMTETRSNSLIASLIPSVDELYRMYATLEDEQSSLSCMLDDEVSKGRFTWGRSNFMRCIAYYLLIQGEKDIALREYPDLLSADPCMFPLISLLADYDETIRPCFYGESYSTIHDFQAQIWSPLKSEQMMMQSSKCMECRGKVFCPR